MKFSKILIHNFTVKFPYAGSTFCVRPMKVFFTISGTDGCNEPFYRVEGERGVEQKFIRL